jgi:hypothetical protein
VVKVKSRCVPNHSSGIGVAISHERAKFYSRSLDAVIRVYDAAAT